MLAILKTFSEFVLPLRAFHLSPALHTGDLSEPGLAQLLLVAGGTPRQTFLDRTPVLGTTYLELLSDMYVSVQQCGTKTVPVKTETSIRKYALRLPILGSVKILV